MKFLKIAGRILGGIVALVVLAGAASYGLGSWKLGENFKVTDSTPTIPSDQASIERGRHFFTAISKCVLCHNENLSGRMFSDGGAAGTLYSANLTRGKGARGALITDQQMVTAIRHGVNAEGHSLLLMPSKFYNRLSDEDVADIVAYIRSVPPVDSAHPKTKAGPLLRVLIGAGIASGLQSGRTIDHTARRPATPPPGPTAEHGSYLAVVGGCKFCHGAGLSGGPLEEGPPGSMPASNLTPEGLKAYDEAKFFTALREGKRPSGVPINNEFMPWKLTALMTDDEIRAVWKYLQTVPPKPYGNH